MIECMCLIIGEVRTKERLEGGVPEAGKFDRTRTTWAAVKATNAGDGN